MLQESISRCYYRWDRLERSLGPKGGLILDFDMAPRGDRAERSAYGSRMEVLEELMRLQEQTRAEADRLQTPTFLLAKLRGAEVYLRALMGQRYRSEDYLRATMGFIPTLPDPQAQEEERSQLQEQLEGLGISWSPAGRPAFKERLHRKQLQGFEADLRREARRLVARLRERLELPEPSYRVEAARADAYWSNWIDGSLEEGVLLRVNTHPRIRYHRDSHLGLASHEIAGHACHVAGLRASAQAGQLDPACLNLAVHSCEAFQRRAWARPSHPC